uniref:ribosomal protein S20 n=1 Tax=Pseudoerythrocladia kornmannii TaxID=753682 RepID=UPI001BF04E2D|nr:ribosomal protein S20 [Pseudoerythrocladia kornmannii]QUE28224.1 ribosomal protein S20 [Pseudoerythrocladia kornmannii]UNJ16729.1 ribosomal protein S20 [Pseudoerythrocladia kornmannii]
MVIKNKSAIKRIKVAARNRSQNLLYKSSVKTLIKKYFFTINSSNSQTDKSMVSAQVSEIYSKLDKATKRGVLHKNTAARKKSLIARSFKALD